VAVGVAVAAVEEDAAGSFAPDTIAVSVPAAVAPLYVTAASQPIEPVAATPSMVVPIVILRRRRLARDRASVRPLSVVFMERSCSRDPFGIVTPASGGPPPA
jgi:hypothetical protein